MIGVGDISLRPSDETMSLSEAVASKIQLREVTLIWTQARRTAASPKEVGSGGEIEFNLQTQPRIKDSVLAVRVRLRLLAKNKEGKELLDIKSEYALGYEVRDSSDFTPKHFEAFANVNAVYHIWPYWRELVHSTTVRMSLDALVLPVLPVLRQKSPARTETPREQSDDPPSPATTVSPV